MAQTDSAAINDEIMEATSNDDSILSGYSVPDRSELAECNQQVENLLTRSQYAMVVFHDIAECYPNDSDLVCRYTLTDGVQATPGDRVVLFLVGWTSLQDYVAFEWAPTPENGERDLAVSFQASILPEDNEFYQVCYVSVGSAVCGASVPFQVRQPKNEELTCAFEEDMVVVRSSTSVAQDHLRTGQSLRMEKQKLLKALKELDNALANVEQENVKSSNDSAQAPEIEETLNKSRDEMAINVAEAEWLLTVTDEMAENKEKLSHAEQRVKELECALANAERENKRAENDTANTSEVKEKLEEKEGIKDKKTDSDIEETAEVKENLEKTEEAETVRLLKVTVESEGKQAERKVEELESSLLIAEREKEIMEDKSAETPEIAEKLSITVKELNELALLGEADGQKTDMLLQKTDEMLLAVQGEFARRNLRIRRLENDLDSAKLENERLQTSVNAFKELADENKIKYEQLKETLSALKDPEDAQMQKESNALLQRIQRNARYYYDWRNCLSILKDTERAKQQLQSKLDQVTQEIVELKSSINSCTETKDKTQEEALQKNISKLKAINQQLFNDQERSNESETSCTTEDCEREKTKRRELEARVITLESLNRQLLEAGEHFEGDNTLHQETLRTRVSELECLNLQLLDDYRVTRLLLSEIAFSDDDNTLSKQLKIMFGRLWAAFQVLMQDYKLAQSLLEKSSLVGGTESCGEDEIQREMRLAYIARFEAMNVQMMEGFKEMINLQSESRLEAVNRKLSEELEAVRNAVIETSQRLLLEEEGNSEVITESGRLQAKVVQLEATNLKLTEDLEASRNIMTEVKEKARTMIGQLKSQHLDRSKELETLRRLSSDYNEVKVESGKLQAKVAQLEATNHKLLEDLKTSQRLRVEREVYVITEDCNGDKTAEELKNENRRLRERLEDTELTVATLEHEKLTLNQLLDDTINAQRSAVTSENFAGDEEMARRQECMQLNASERILDREELKRKDSVVLESNRMASLEEDLDLALRSNVVEAEARAALELENASLRNKLTEIMKKVDKLTMENRKLLSELNDKCQQTSEENDGPTVRILLKELAECNKTIESLAMDIQKERSNFTLEIERLRLENEDLATRNILLVQREVQEGEENSEIRRLTYMYKILQDQNAELSEKLQRSGLNDANARREQQNDLQRELATTKEENESMRNTLKATQEQLNATWEEMKKTLCHLEQEKAKKNSAQAEMAADPTKDCRLSSLTSQNKVILNKLNELGAKLERWSGQQKAGKINPPRLLKIPEHFKGSRKLLDSANCSLKHMSNPGDPSDAELKQRLERAAEEYKNVYSEMVHYKEKYVNLRAKIVHAIKAAAVCSEEEGEVSASKSEEAKEETMKEGVDKEPRESASESSGGSLRKKALKIKLSTRKSSSDGSWAWNGSGSQTAFDDHLTNTFRRCHGEHEKRLTPGSKKTGMTAPGKIETVTSEKKMSSEAKHLPKNASDALAHSNSTELPKNACSGYNPDSNARPKCDGYNVAEGYSTWNKDC